MSIANSRPIFETILNPILTGIDHFTRKKFRDIQVIAAAANLLLN